MTSIFLPERLFKIAFRETPLRYMEYHENRQTFLMVDFTVTVQDNTATAR